MAQFFAASLFFASTTLINISFIDGRTWLNEITVPEPVIDLMISFVSPSGSFNADSAPALCK
jgi:hypothetical protein